MIDRRVETSHGPIRLWGAPEAFDANAARPVLFGITGAFAQHEGPLFHLGPQLAPAADVIFGHLPGNHCPLLSAHGPVVYAAAYAEALQATLPDRAVVACGLSIGGLAVLAMDSPQVRRSIVVEPPLVMSKLWPMRPILAQRLSAATANPHFAAFVGAIFGDQPDGRHEERRYDGLLAGVARPTHVLVGSAPLRLGRPLAPGEGLPSLVDTPERDLMAAHPCIRVTEIPGTGHNVPQQNPAAFLAVIREELALLP